MRAPALLRVCGDPRLSEAAASMWKPRWLSGGYGIPAFAGISGGLIFIRKDCPTAPIWSRSAFD